MGEPYSNPCVAVDAVQRLRVVEAVGQACGVREQVPHPHGLGRRHRERLVLAAAGPDPRVRERGDEALDRVVELERALLPQQHRRDGRDRLGHRVDAELRVELDRQAAPRRRAGRPWRCGRLRRRGRSARGSRAACPRRRSAGSGGRCGLRRSGSKPASTGSVSTESTAAHVPKLSPTALWSDSPRPRSGEFPDAHAVAGLCGLLVLPVAASAQVRVLPLEPPSVIALG